MSSAFALPQEEVHPWYALQTRTGYEKIASTVLDGKGYRYYLPVYKKKRRWSDRVVELEQPLFPGYVFCRFDVNQRLPIFTTPGVIAIVGLGKNPSPIAEQEIHAIQTILESNLFAEPCPYLAVGQKVRIERGALAGLEGMLVSKKNEWRFVVSVSMLQRSVSVELDREWLSGAR